MDEQQSLLGVPVQGQMATIMSQVTDVQQGCSLFFDVNKESRAYSRIYLPCMKLRGHLKFYSEYCPLHPEQTCFGAALFFVSLSTERLIGTSNLGNAHNGSIMSRRDSPNLRRSGMIGLKDVAPTRVHRASELHSYKQLTFQLISPFQHRPYGACLLKLVCMTIPPNIVLLHSA